VTKALRALIAGNLVPEQIEDQRATATGFVVKKGVTASTKELLGIGPGPTARAVPRIGTAPCVTTLALLEKTHRRSVPGTGLVYRHSSVTVTPLQNEATGLARLVTNARLAFMAWTVEKSVQVEFATFAEVVGLAAMAKAGREHVLATAQMDHFSETQIAPIVQLDFSAPTAT